MKILITLLLLSTFSITMKLKRTRGSGEITVRAIYFEKKAVIENQKLLFEYDNFVITIKNAEEGSRESHSDDRTLPPQNKDTLPITLDLDTCNDDFDSCFNLISPNEIHTYNLRFRDEENVTLNKIKKLIQSKRETIIKHAQSEVFDDDIIVKFDEMGKNFHSLSLTGLAVFVDINKHYLKIMRNWFPIGKAFSKDIDVVDNFSEHAKEIIDLIDRQPYPKKFQEIKLAIFNKWNTVWLPKYK
jgi:hypothetical protein